MRIGAHDVCLYFCPQFSLTRNGDAGGGERLRSYIDSTCVIVVDDLVRMEIGREVWDLTRWRIDGTMI